MESVPRPQPIDDEPLQSFDQLADDICAGAANLTSYEYRWLRQVAEFDRRRGWAQWEQTSCAAWLAWQVGLDARSAREKVRVARALDDFPLVAATMQRGHLCYSKVRALTRVVTPATESALVQLALDSTTAQLERIVAATRRASFADETDAQQAWHGRRLDHRTNPDGSVVVTLRLPADDGVTFLSAVDAFVTEKLPGDPYESAATRRADAALAMAVTATSLPATVPSLAPQPLITVHIDCTSSPFDLRAETPSAPTPPTPPNPPSVRTPPTPPNPPSPPSPPSVRTPPTPVTPPSAPSDDDSAVHVNRSTAVLAPIPPDVPCGNTVPARTPLVDAAVGETSSGVGAGVGVGVGAGVDDGHDTDDELAFAGASALDRDALDPVCSVAGSTPDVVVPIALTPAAVLRACCDGRVETVTHHDDGEVTVSRRSSVIRGTLRRSILARDHHCQFPGCTRSAGVEVHHLVHRAHGGDNHPDNLVVLCRYHHHRLHDEHWSARRTSAGLEFVAPDGRVVGAVAPSDGAAQVVMDLDRTAVDGRARWQGDRLQLVEALNFLASPAAESERAARRRFRSLATGRHRHGATEHRPPHHGPHHLAE